MRQLILAAAAALLIPISALPVLAQAAPIRMGQTASEYTQPVQPLSTDAIIARQQAKLGELEQQMSLLTGRMENLEFRLTQNERERQELAQENTKLLERLVELEGKFKKLTERAPTNNPSSFTKNPADTENRRVWTNSVSATQIPAQRPSEVIKPKTGAIGVQASDVPLTQGSLGQLPASELPGEAGALFRMGKDSLLAFDYQNAERAFMAFLDEFGDDPQAGEAHYWLGEAMFQQKDYVGSAKFFQSFLQEYPQDPRRGDALVKLARAFREIDQKPQACKFLSKLDLVAPDASEAIKTVANVERQKSGCR